ncbi:glycoside hydrolase family 18 protein [Chitinimonas sp.]|uniref:glycoside hydrolase family 18 protein n=1 Tax=Chitinimonas sp. TaxID=1934313 RepID=UPI002F948D64
MRAICLHLILACCMLMALPAVAQDPADYKIVAYYFSEASERLGYGPERIPADKLTHLMYAFAEVKDGKAVLTPTAEGRRQLAGLQALKRQYPKLRTLLSIGGWGGSKYFSDVALDPEARQRFAGSAVALMRHYGFDGLDIDWEYPVEGGAEGNIVRPADKTNYTLLLQAVRAALDKAGKPAGRHYLLTSATGAGERWLNHTEMREAVRYLDWVNLMSYDFNGLWNKFSGHVAPLYHDPAYQRDGTSPLSNVSSAIDLYRKAGVPADKIMLGLPFYGYAWKQCAPAGNGQYQDCNGPGGGANSEGSIRYGELATHFIDRNGYTRHWNDVTKTPYLVRLETGEFISYEDVESLDYKLQFLKAQRLAGAMFWELTGDPDGVLLDRLNLRLRKAGR